MAEYFAGGHLRFVNGEWRDDNGDTIEISRVRHGRWVDNGIPDSILSGCSVCGFTCGSSSFFYCPNCGAKMDLEATKMDDEKCPCETCPDKDHCDGWEAQFCCTLCQWYGNDDCDNCDPFDI